MAFRSILVVDIVPGKRAEAVATFVEKDFIGECGQAIPSFLAGRIWLSSVTADRMNVECDWSVEQGWHDWLASPVRARQMDDLGHYVSAIVASEVFEAFDS